MDSRDLSINVIKDGFRDTIKKNIQIGQLAPHKGGDHNIFFSKLTFFFQKATFLKAASINSGSPIMSFHLFSGQDYDAQASRAAH